MRIYWPSMATSVALLISGSCSRQPASGYTERQVAAVVVPGEAKEVVDRTFGRPSFMLPPIGDGTVTAAYSMPVPRRAAKQYRHKFAGFEVDYRNGRVVRWSPVYSDLVEYHSAASDPVSNTNLPKCASVKLYVVKETEFNGGHLLDTPATPKAGYISHTPDLSVPSVRSVTAGDMSGTPAIEIQLNPADAAALRELTATNLGNRIAFAVGTNIVSAPIVRGAINNGQFTVTFPSPAQRDEAVQLLRGSR